MAQRLSDPGPCDGATIRSRDVVLVSLEDLDATDAARALGAEDAALDAVVDAPDRQRTIEVVRAALATLPEPHARILKLRYLDELTPRAIMRHEGLSTPKQYEGRHRRAIRLLAERLRDQDVSAR